MNPKMTEADIQEYKSAGYPYLVDDGVQRDAVHWRVMCAANRIAHQVFGECGVDTDVCLEVLRCYWAGEELSSWSWEEMPKANMTAEQVRAQYNKAMCAAGDYLTIATGLPHVLNDIEVVTPVGDHHKVYWQW